MKIGVALSGCSAGGVCACSALRLLEEKGFDIDMVSACSFPSVGAMMYACGFGPEKARKTASRFLSDAAESDVDSAAAHVSACLPARLMAKDRKLAVNAADASGKQVVTFTNAFSLNTEKIRTYPLLDAYDALSATISAIDGLCGYRYRNAKLYDYSMWHGCPVYPLKIRGLPRILSVSFLPAEPKTSYEALVQKMTRSGANGASVHIPVSFEAGAATFSDYEAAVLETLEKNMNRIYWRTLF